MAHDGTHKDHDCCDGPYCHSQKRGDPPGWCHRPSGWGTDHAGIGKCKLHGGATRNHIASARQEKARRAVATYGLPHEVDPATALLEEVHRTAGHIAWLREKVAALDETDLVGAEPSPWLHMYQDERRHLARVARSAIDAGCNERLVRLAEQQGLMLAQVIRRIAAELLNATADLLDDAATMERIRQAWPGLLSQIVPREIAAVAATRDDGGDRDG